LTASSKPAPTFLILKFLTKTNEDIVLRQNNFIWDVVHAEQKTANQVVAKATVAVVRAVATD
jgi:hypothetical protein